MIKKILFSAFCVCMLCFTGCSLQPQEAQLNARRPMVMIEESIYLDTGKEILKTIDDDAILGEILSEVAVSEIPTKNDEGNFDCIGVKYASYENGFALKLKDGWFFFEPEET